MSGPFLLAGDRNADIFPNNACPSLRTDCISPCADWEELGEHARTPAHLHHP